jgi:hypothetical protein
MAGAGKPCRASLAQSRCWNDFVRRRHVVAGPAFAVRPARHASLGTAAPAPGAALRTYWSNLRVREGIVDAVLRCDARAGRAPLRAGAPAHAWRTRDIPKRGHGAPYTPVQTSSIALHSPRPDNSCSSPAAQPNQVRTMCAKLCMSAPHGSAKRASDDGGPPSPLPPPADTLPALHVFAAVAANRPCRAAAACQQSAPHGFASSSRPVRGSSQQRPLPRFCVNVRCRKPALRVAAPGQSIMYVHMCRSRQDAERRRREMGSARTGQRAGPGGGRGADGGG